MSIAEQNERELTKANLKISLLELQLTVRDEQIDSLQRLVELYKKTEQRLTEELTNKK